MVAHLINSFTSFFLLFFFYSQKHELFVHLQYNMVLYIGTKFSWYKNVPNQNKTSLLVKLTYKLKKYIQYFTYDHTKTFFPRQTKQKQ